MTLAYAEEHLSAAVRSLAVSEASLQERLQRAWDDHVQLVWEKPCLTRDLLREFAALWERYTAPSSNPRSTILRATGNDELRRAIGELCVLSIRTAIAAAQATPDTQLAKMADL